EYTWGTAAECAGAGIACQLYAELGGGRAYGDLARRQRDYLLGLNPEGASFLIGAGTVYPKHPHHPLADLAGNPLAGALGGGPSPRRAWERWLPPGDRQLPVTPAAARGPRQESVVYHDATWDYVTNEPAIDYAANALFLLASLAAPP